MSTLAILGSLGNSPVPAAVNLIANGYKKLFEEKSQLVTQLCLAELKSGRSTLEDMAEKDAFISGHYKITDAAFKGAANSNLRLMCKILRNCLEQEIQTDEINSVLSIASELSQEEVFLLAEFWKFWQKKNSNNSVLFKEFHNKFVPSIYSNQYLNALSEM